MNPYVMMLLQRLGASPAGQRAGDVLDRMRLFEASRIPLTRGSQGRYLPATPMQKVPLSPIGRGVAGAGGLGMVASDPEAIARRSASLLEQLNERGASAAPVSVSQNRVPIPPGLFEELNARGAAAEQPVREMMPARAMDSTLFGEDVGPRPAPMRQISPLDSSMSGQDVFGPMPPRRPANLPGARDIPLPPRRPEGIGSDTRAAESVLSRIFSGRDYQTNSRPVVQDRRVNFGDPESAADFFRAERAAREMGTLPPIERASGGQVQNGKAHKDAALVKALEIIERLMHR